eukprot:9979513-Heterocapsa_arctica.AAC.1
MQCRGDGEEPLALPRAPASVERESARTAAPREGEPRPGGMEAPRPGVLAGERVARCGDAYWTAPT